MKINIAYFTSTGNTLWLANVAKEMIEKEGHKVTLYDIVTSNIEIFENCDLLGIFYPVWCSTIPDLFKELFLGMKPIKSNLKVFLIGNYGAFTGDTGIYWRKQMKKKGLDVFYVNNLIMPINLNIPKFNYWKVPEEEKIKQILQDAKKSLAKMCKEIIELKQVLKGRGIIDRIGGGGQRLFYGILEKWKKKFSIDEEHCTRCGFCYKICPTNNIQFSNKKPITFSDNCIFCLKCYNLCPQNAVLIDVKSKNTVKYRRYKGPDKKIKVIKYRELKN